MKVEVTNDGSCTVKSERFHENYHSKWGAVQESQHVFIKNGLEKIEKPTVKILEMGFGTGLNALLSLIFASEYKQKIEYTTLELFPITKDIFEQLQYTSFLKKLEFEGGFRELHESKWSAEHKISSFFTFKKFNENLVNYQFSNLDQFDLIFYDAFSPEKQPELWTPELFKKIFNTTEINGRLVTYCAKGIVKRVLKSVGFTVKAAAGPPGKREMIIAEKLNP